MSVFYRFAAVCGLLLIFATQMNAAFVAAPVATAELPTAETSQSSAVDPAAFDREVLEERLGRKLKFRERIALGVLKRKARRQQKRAARSSVDEAGYGNGMAIAGFVLGILGLLLLSSLLLAILAIVFSAIGLRKANREGRPHRGLAIAGLVMGILGAVLGVLLIIFFIISMTA